MAVALTRLTPPAALPVSLLEAKAFLRVDGSDDDTLISSLIAAAVASLDGERGDLGRCLVSQTWRLDLDAFPRRMAIEIPLPPMIEVVSVAYTASDGAAVTMPTDDFTVVGAGSYGFARIAPTSGLWPVGTAVTVTFRAGFGEVAADVPADLRGAILARVATAYSVRESSVLATASFRDAPDTADTLARWRASWW